MKPLTVVYGNTFSFNGDRQNLGLTIFDTVTVGDHVTKALDLGLQEHRLKLHEVLDFSKDWVGHIRHKLLGKRKRTARWVLYLLTPNNKRNHETACPQCLTVFKRNPKEFLRDRLTAKHGFSGTTGTHQRLNYSSLRTLSYRAERCPIGQIVPTTLRRTHIRLYYTVILDRFYVELQKNNPISRSEKCSLTMTNDQSQ